MTYKSLLFACLMCSSMYASPITITLNLTGGSFDTGNTTPGVDTGSGFSVSSATCSGIGCASLPSTTGLEGLLVNFTVPTGSTTGAGSTATGTEFASLKINAFTLTGAPVSPAFDANSSFTENVAATGVLGTVVLLTGTIQLNWNGNSAVQARSATGTIVLNGDVAAVPEPSTVGLLSLPLLGLLFRKKTRTT